MLLLCEGFPNENAAHIALETIRSWLETEDHHEKVIYGNSRVLFLIIFDLCRLIESSFVFSLMLTIKYTNV